MRSGSEERARRRAHEGTAGSDAGIFGGDDGIVRRDFADADAGVEKRGEVTRESDHIARFREQEGWVKRITTRMQGTSKMELRMHETS